MPLEDEFAAEIRNQLVMELQRYGLGDVLELAIARASERQENIAPATRQNLSRLFQEVIDILRSWSPVNLAANLEKINRAVQTEHPLTHVNLVVSEDPDETPFDLATFTDYGELADELQSILNTILEESE